MTAYVLNASGDWNNPLIWTPNGVPGEADTFTAGVFALTIPENYTAKIAGFVVSGTATSTRTRIIGKNGAKLELYGNASSTNFMNLEAEGNFEIDLRGYSLELGTTGNAAVTRVVKASGGILKIWSSTTLGYFGRPAALQKSGDIDVSGLLCVNITWRYGGNFNSGNHFILRNFIFYNCGYIDAYEYIHPTANWVLENGDFRGSQVTSGNNVYLSARNNSGTITGQRVLKNITFNYVSSVGKIVSLRYMNASVPMDGLYGAGTQFSFGDSVNFTVQKFFSAKQGIVGGFEGNVDKIYVTPDTGNPHTLENFIAKTFSSSVLESIYPDALVNPGDHLICKAGAVDVLTTNCLFIDTRGGVLYNALKANTIGKFVLQKCTYVVDAVSNEYGQLARNESGSKFEPASDLRIHSNINHIRNNLSGSANIRVVNFAPNDPDQVKYIDYNLYNGHGSDNSIKFFGMTSATKTYGVTDGWGLHDIHNVDPMFVDQNRGIVSWGAQFGYADYDETVYGILNSVNGFDEATLTQTGNVPGRSVTDLIDWVSAGFVPQNPVIATAAMDGSTIGAFEYVAPEFEVNVDPIIVSTDFSSPAITQVLQISVDDINLTNNFSSPAITQALQISVDDINVSTDLTQPSLTGSFIVSPSELSVNIALSSPSISYSGALTVSDFALSPLFSSPLLQAGYIIAPHDLNVHSVISNPSVGDLVTGSIRADRLVQVMRSTLLVQVRK